MRGQAYTVTNMLVWAAFGVAFLVAVLAAYHYLSSMTPPTYMRQIHDAVVSAWKARYDPSAGPVVVSHVTIPAGTVFSPQVIGKWVGARQICLFAGPGFSMKGRVVVAPGGVTAKVLVCCQGTTCWLGFNVLSQTCRIPGSVCTSVQ